MSGSKPQGSGERTHSPLFEMHTLGTQRALSALMLAIKPAAEAAVREATAAAWEDARATMKYKDRTGRLRNQTKWFANGYRGRVVANTFYALFLEAGTGIYGPRGRPIVPIHAKFLHWVDRGGMHHFRKSVKGIKPMRFMAHASKRGANVLHESMRHEADKAIDRFNR